MKSLACIAFTAFILLGVAIEAQATANFDATIGEQGMRHLPSYLQVSSVLRYARDGIDDGVPTFGNCTNTATCGASWIRKVFVGPNCQSSAQVYFEKLSNMTASGTCESLQPNVNASLLTVCDRSLNALGGWIHLGLDSCPSSGRSQFNGYTLGTCINTDSEDPLASTASFAVYCNFKDAANAKPSASYPAFAADSPLAGTGCPNNASSCDAIAYMSSWNSSSTCQANASQSEPLIPGVLLNTCYNLSDVTLPDSANLKMTCKPDFLHIGTYGRGCAASARTFLTLYSTKQCIGPALSAGSNSSSRFYCKYDSAGTSLYNTPPLLMVLALFALIML